MFQNMSNIFSNISKNIGEKKILTNAPVAVLAAIEVELLLLVNKAGSPIGHHWLPFNKCSAQC